MAEFKKKKNKKKYTGPQLIKSPDVYTGDQYSNMMDEITITDKNPNLVDYPGLNVLGQQLIEPSRGRKKEMNFWTGDNREWDEQGNELAYEDANRTFSGIAPSPSGSLKGLASMVKNIPQLIKNVPKYAKQLKSLRGVINPSKFAADGSRIDPSKLTKLLKVLLIQENLK